MAGSAIPSKAELIEYTEQHPVWASASEQRLQVRMGRCCALRATRCARWGGGTRGSQKAGAAAAPGVGCWAAVGECANCLCVSLLQSSSNWLATHPQPCALLVGPQGLASLQASASPPPPPALPPLRIGQHCSQANCLLSSPLTQGLGSLLASDSAAAGLRRSASARRADEASLPAAAPERRGPFLLGPLPASSASSPPQRRALAEAVAAGGSASAGGVYAHGGVAATQPDSVTFPPPLPARHVSVGGGSSGASGFDMWS